MFDPSQRLAARIAGLIYLLTFLIVIAAFVRFYAPYLVWDNVAETARNIAAHRHDYRIYIAGAMLNGIGLVILPAALYLLLRPINRGLALFAAWSRMVYAVMWFAEICYGLSALRIVSGAPYLQAFEPDRLRALAGLQLASGWDAYYVGLTFYGLSTAVFAWLWFQSRYIPRWLALWGLAAALFEGVCGFAYLTFPSFGSVVSVNYYELPLMLFELPLSILLLWKGFRPSRA
jgi:hypothetical protein